MHSDGRRFLVLQWQKMPLQNLSVPCTCNRLCHSSSLRPTFSLAYIAASEWVDDTLWVSPLRLVYCTSIWSQWLGEKQYSVAFLEGAFMLKHWYPGPMATVSTFMNFMFNTWCLAQYKCLPHLVVSLVLQWVSLIGDIIYARLHKCMFTAWNGTLKSCMNDTCVSVF